MASIEDAVMRVASALDSDVALDAAERIPMGRLGTPEEFAVMTCWIMSEDCWFTAGFTFDLLGGRAVY